MSNHLPPHDDAPHSEDAAQVQLTAFVLGELPETERAEWEQKLAASADLRAEAQAIREAASLVFAALQSEPAPSLTDQQRSQILELARQRRRTASEATPRPRTVIAADDPTKSGNRWAVLATVGVLTACLVLIVTSATAPTESELASRETAAPADTLAQFDAAADLVQGLAVDESLLALDERTSLSAAHDDTLALSVTEGGDVILGRFVYYKPMEVDPNQLADVSDIDGDGVADNYFRYRVEDLSRDEAELDGVRLMERGVQLQEEEWSRESAETHTFSVADGEVADTNLYLFENGRSFYPMFGGGGGAPSASDAGVVFQQFGVNGASPNMSLLVPGLSSSDGYHGEARFAIPATEPALTLPIASSGYAFIAGEAMPQVSSGSAYDFSTPEFYYESNGEQMGNLPLQQMNESLIAGGMQGGRGQGDASYGTGRPLGTGGGYYGHYFVEDGLTDEMETLAELEGRLPSVRYLRSDVQFFPAGPETQLPQGGHTDDLYLVSPIPLEEGEPRRERMFDLDVNSEYDSRLARLEDLAWGTQPMSWEDGGWYYDGYNSESYAPIVENPFKSPMEEPVATLGVDVDTASYSNVRRFIEGGQWPPADAVRIEELLNSFTYDYPQPEAGEPFSVTMEVAACPWQPEHRLMRVGMQARDVDLAARPATSLVFLIDVSGSMSDADKLPLVQESLKLLLSQMTENDRLAIVTYRDTAQVALQSITGDRRDDAIAIIDSLHADGSTNGAGGLELAYEVATTNFIREGQNRVIICTDGDFNVGESSDDAMVQLIEAKRETGVFLSVFGFGEGNLQDSKLEGIADHGNGQYAYIDDMDQARRKFLDELTGTLYTVAKDVKLQVEFNPLLVRGYRLIGYENRVLAAEDFNNDSVDAGDVGAGHTVTALFEIVPGSSIGEVQPSVDPLRYQRVDPIDPPSPSGRGAVGEGEALEGASEQDNTVPRFYRLTTLEAEAAADTVTALLGVEASVEAKDASSLEIDATVEHHAQAVELLRTLGEEPQVAVAWQVAHQEQVVVPAEFAHELCVVKVRYKQPTADESVRREFPVDDRDQPMTAPSRDFHWATAVAGYGMLVRQSPHRGDISWNAVIEIAHGARGEDADGRRAEFVALAQQTRDLWYTLHGIDNSPQPVSLDSTQARDRAACGGKYSNLLDKIDAPGDFTNYGNFHDYGWWDGTEYQGHTGLPPAYWVYVQPHWYLWGEMHEEVTASPPPTFWSAPQVEDVTTLERQLSFTGEIPLAEPAAASIEPIDVMFSGVDVSIETIDALAGQQIGTLSLMGAQFDGAIIEGLRHTASIESLRLYGEGLSGQIPRLANITGLTSLELGAPLRLMDLEAISELGNLRHLKLPGELAITVTGARNIAKLRGLTSLDLYNCQLDDASFGELFPLQQLEHLDLSLTQVSDAGLPTLTYFPHLKTLRLDRNWTIQPQITDNIVPTLVSLTQLETLSLWGTSISNDGLTQLASLPSLKSLSIGQTQVTGDGLAALVASNVESLTLSPEQVGTFYDGHPLLQQVTQPMLQEIHQRHLDQRYPASPVGEPQSGEPQPSQDPPSGSECDDSGAVQSDQPTAVADSIGRPIGTTGPAPIADFRRVVRFADTAEQFARQLDYFGIELVARIDGRLIFLTNASTTPVTRDLAMEDEEYDEWSAKLGQLVATRREVAVTLFQNAGFDVSEGEIFDLYPEEAEQLLTNLEHDYAGRTADEIRRTYFVVETVEEGYTLRVTRQIRRTPQNSGEQPADEAEGEPQPSQEAPPGSMCDDTVGLESEVGGESQSEQPATERPMTGTHYTGGTRTEDRWVIRFADTGSVEGYARQLDYFGIELGVLFTDPGRLIFMSNISTTPTTREVTTANGEERFYMTWLGSDREDDVKLFENVGIDASEGRIFHFYSDETVRMLSDLEVEYAGRDPQQIRRTYFVVDSTEDGYAFRVTRQVAPGSQSNGSEPASDPRSEPQSGVGGQSESPSELAEVVQPSLDQIEADLMAQMPGLMHLREMPRLQSVLVIGQFHSQASMVVWTTLAPHVQWGFIDP